MTVDSAFLPSFLPWQLLLAAFFVLFGKEKMLSFIVVRGSREATLTLLHTPFCVLA